MQAEDGFFTHNPYELASDESKAWADIERVALLSYQQNKDGDYKTVQQMQCPGYVKDPQGSINKTLDEIRNSSPTISEESLKFKGDILLQVYGQMCGTLPTPEMRTPDFRVDVDKSECVPGSGQAYVSYALSKAKNYDVRNVVVSIQWLDSAGHVVEQETKITTNDVWEDDHASSEHSKKIADCRVSVQMF